MIASCWRNALESKQWVQTGMERAKKKQKNKVVLIWRARINLSTVDKGKLSGQTDGET